MGGKSSSSNATSSAQTTTTTTGSATGTVGSVYQGQTVNITDQLPESAVNVFKELIHLTGNAIDVAAAAGSKALDNNAALTTTIKQPDVALAQGGQKNTQYAIIAAAVVGIALFMRK